MKCYVCFILFVNLEFNNAYISVLRKESFKTVMDNNFTNINKTNSYSSQTQVMVWDRHKHVGRLNQLTGFKPYLSNNWVSHGNTDIKQTNKNTHIRFHPKRPKLKNEWQNKHGQYVCQYYLHVYVMSVKSSTELMLMT